VLMIHYDENWEHHVMMMNHPRRNYKNEKKFKKSKWNFLFLFFLNINVKKLNIFFYHSHPYHTTSLNCTSGMFLFFKCQ
jgi:hypothetical protein